MNKRYLFILTILLVTCNVYSGGADVYVPADGKAITLLNQRKFDQSNYDSKTNAVKETKKPVKDNSHLKIKNTKEEIPKNSTN